MADALLVLISHQLLSELKLGVTVHLFYDLLSLDQRSRLHHELIITKSRIEH